MAEYETQEWADDASGGTPINAAALNHMESGIAQASQDATNALTDADTAKTNASEALEQANNSVKKIGDTMIGPLILETPLAASSGGTGQTSLQATRNAMGLGNTTGALPVANGGTGITSNPSMLTNLGSTGAANVFASSPRPGITGVLGIANGGTGSSTTSGALSNLGLAPKKLSVQKGNDATGITTASAWQYGKVVCISAYVDIPAQSSSWANPQILKGLPVPANTEELFGTAKQNDTGKVCSINVLSTGVAGLRLQGGAAPSAGRWIVDVAYVAK
ncbi:hypothetical protein HGI81_05670 [Olsenella sp. KGMB02461]|nr:hypothetical protein [Olsenella sp. KGMB02461]